MNVGLLFDGAPFARGRPGGRGPRGDARRPRRAPAGRMRAGRASDLSPCPNLRAAPRSCRRRSRSACGLLALLGLFGAPAAWASSNSLCAAVPPPPPAPAGTCPVGGAFAAQQMRAACGGKSTPAPKTPAPACTPVPSSPKAKAAYWQTLTVASGTVSEVAKLEGWSPANDPSQGVVPGVCYNDQAGHGTVGYGNEYPKGLSCSTLASTHNALYEHYLAHPLHPNGPRALALLQKDIATDATAPIDQYLTKEITAQQLNALIPWVYNIGAKPNTGFPASDALAAINLKLPRTKDVFPWPFKAL